MRTIVLSPSARGQLTRALAECGPLGEDPEPFLAAVFARMGAQKIVGVFRERIAAQPGEALPISPNPQSVHLFDKETGLRLN